MPAANNPEKAYLQEISWDDQGAVASEGRKLEVQFNPETLKVTFTNQISGDDNKGGAAIQFASRGTTKLAAELWFDVTAPAPDTLEETDVRKLTSEVALFMKAESTGSGEETKYIPPGVRFQWGTFLFEGVMESINESLEYFSRDGRPLRASVAISLVRQDVEVTISDSNAAAAGAGTPAAGTRPVDLVRAGDTAQSVAARNGLGSNWQASAFAAGIENPLRIEVGTLIETTGR